MKRLLSLSLTVASLFGFGINANAATSSPQTTALLASTSEFSEEQIIIYVSNDSKNDPILNSIFSSFSYVQIPKDFLSLFLQRSADTNKGDAGSVPVAQTNKPALQSGGTAGTGTTNNTGITTGTGNGIETSKPIPTISQPPLIVSQPASTVSQQTTTTSQPTPTTLKITSIYPNTTGNDTEEEYVVITNTGEQNVNLKDWSLKDASGKTFTFASDTFLAPGSQTQLKRTQTNIALNNDADEISLFAPDNSLIDKTSYENAPKGEIYKWTDGIWVWPSEIQTNESTPVPTIQTVVVPESETKQSDTIKIEPSTKKSETVTKTLPTNGTIAQAKNEGDQTEVKISGVVNVLPGVLGKQFFYIQDDEAGIQIYKHDGLFPELSVGQKIIVKGEMSTNGSERRVKVGKTGSIELMAETVALIPKQSALSELKLEDVGQLFTVSGMVNESGTDKLKIEKDGQTLEVAITTQSGIDTTTISPGSSLQVTGIVRSSGDGVKLSPRSQEDLVILSQPTDPLITGTIENGKDIQNQMDQKTAITLAAGSGLVMIAFIVRHLIHKQKTVYAIDQPIELTTENVH